MMAIVMITVIMVIMDSDGDTFAAVVNTNNERRELGRWSTIAP